MNLESYLMGGTETNSTKRYITNCTPDDKVSNNSIPKKFIARGVQSSTKVNLVLRFLLKRWKDQERQTTKYYQDQASKYIMLPKTNCIVWSFCKKQNKTKQQTFRFTIPTANVYLGC